MAQRAASGARADWTPRVPPPPQVCKISGLIINNEESRLTDHYAGRNYKCVRACGAGGGDGGEAARPVRARPCHIGS